MKDFKTLEDLVVFIKEEKCYYDREYHKDYDSLVIEANKHFSSITEDIEDRDDYYDSFGLKVGECHTDLVKKEKYKVEEGNTYVTVHFYECYIDYGVPVEDCFYGFYITNL